MPSLRAVFSLLFLGVVSGCSSQPETPPEPPVPFERYSAETFFDTTTYWGSSISADDQRVLITSDESGVFNVYAVDVSDGRSQQLTFSESDSYMALSWFPSDDRFLFTADQGGNELNHVYVMAEDGSVTDLTPGEELKASFWGWSDDRQSFFVATNERDSSSFDLYRYDTSEYSREMVFENTDSLSIEAISPSGEYVAATESLSNANNELYLFHQGQKHHISYHEGNVQFGAYTFSPDSSTLYYSTNQHGEFVQSWMYDIENKAHHVDHFADWDITSVAFSQHGQFKVVSTNEDASTTVTIRDTRSDTLIDTSTFPSGELFGFNASSNGEYFVFYADSDTSPANLYHLDVATGSITQLTTSLPEAIAPDNLVSSEVVRFESFDGLQVPALLYRPIEASSTAPAPTVIWIHGGPGGQSRTGYSETIQHLVNHGYGVLAINNRGSSGYGKTFYHLDDLRHGEDDLQDVVYAKYYLQGLDWTDDERVGVIGGSYGGYLTMAAMAFTDEFAVGVNIFGVTNWVRTLESIPPWWASFRESLYAELGDPAVDGERLRAISPLFHADQVQRPVLVVQGANDPRVLQVESDEMVAAIRQNGVPVEYVLFPDEGHGFRKKENRIRASEAYLEFLNKYL